MASELKSRKMANRLLAALPNYHPFIPISDIDSALTAAGLRETESAIYCGREGHSTMQVGEKSFLSLSWFKMESGNYEIVAYVS